MSKEIPEDNVCDRSGNQGDQTDPMNFNKPEDGCISFSKKHRPETPDSDVKVPPSPPKQVTIDQLADAANSFYKMSLAHEISMDSNFKVEKPPENEKASFQKVVQETMHRAFWDVQRAHLHADPPNYEPALELIREIRKSLQNLVLPHQATLKMAIADRLDVESAEEELRRTGRVNLEAFAGSVFDMLAEWCAPVRDDDVARLKDISEPIEFFRQTFAVLEMMHMDLANFTIQKMRPYIRQQAGEYEREKFDTLLEVQKNAGVDGLARTRDWLVNAFESLKSSSSSLNDPPTPNNILREAYLALLTWDNTKDFPETIAMDAKRMNELVDCLSRTVSLASLVLVVCNTVASNHSSIIPSSMTLQPPPQGSIVRLKEAVCGDAKGIIDGTPASKIRYLAEVLKLRMLLVVETWRMGVVGGREGRPDDVEAPRLQCPQFAMPDAVKEQLCGQIDAVLAGKHPVYTLMFSRALGFLRSTLSARPPDPIPLPAGFGALSPSSSSSLLPTGTAQSAPVTMPVPPPLCALEKPMAIAQQLIVDGGGGGGGGCATESLSRVYDLSLIASRLMPLVAHNRHVFGPHYAEIIQGLLLPLTPATSETA